MYGFLSLCKHIQTSAFLSFSNVEGSPWSLHQNFTLLPWYLLQNSTLQNPNIILEKLIVLFTFLIFLIPMEDM